MSKKVLIIKVDTNDADYIEDSIDISDETLNHIKPVIEAIKQFKPYKGKADDGYESTHRHNWPNGEYGFREDLGEKSPQELYVETGLCTQEQLEDFDEMVPYHEHGFHTIESIHLLEIVDDIKLL